MCGAIGTRGILVPEAFVRHVLDDGTSTNEVHDEYDNDESGEGELEHRSHLILLVVLAKSKDPYIILQVI